MEAEGKNREPGRRIRWLFQTLKERYGPLGWWPGESAMEICAGAILTQNTSWKNAEKAIANLKARGLMDAASLARTDASQTETLVRPSGFYRQKAERLRLFASCVMERLGGRVESLSDMSLEQARGILTGLNGVGEETADAMLAYACGFPVFVADAYAGRILNRLGIAAERSGYRKLQKIVEEGLGKNAADLREMHALIVELGKNLCRARPLCASCFLSASCPHGTRVLDVENGIADGENKEQRDGERNHEGNLGRNPGVTPARRFH